VGLVKLTSPIPSGGYVSIIASTDDPTTTEIDGFVPGHTISCKFWDTNTSSIIDRITPSYTLGDGTFSSLGTAVLGLDGSYTITQDIQLTTGWNIFSLILTPSDPDMQNILNPLINSSKLVKVQDESGAAIEQLPPPIGWINSIGDWSATEGYYIKVNADATLSLTDLPVELPLTIPLNNAWNIISYPVSTEQDAMTALDPLITSNQLIKVQDESGNAVENLPVIGWINNIGNFKPGEGYYLRANTNTTLTLNEPTTMPVQNNGQQTSGKPQYVTANHFQPPTPYLPMNIYVTEALQVGGVDLSAGDEIGIFDGSICVGAYVLTGPITSYISMVASADDPTTSEIDGFTTGNTITYKFWISSLGEEISDYTANYSTGDGTFAPQGTAVVSFTEVLPVELLSFTANTDLNKISLNWETATEVNNYGFEIERKTTGSENWKKIAFVDGYGNSNSPKSYRYLDKSVTGGSKFEYRLKQIDNDGQYKYSDSIEVSITPMSFELLQNYPNPFNSTTNIQFTVSKTTELKINVYTILGEKVLTAAKGKYDPGFYRVKINTSGLPSGIYIYRLESTEFTSTKKMVYLK